MIPLSTRSYALFSMGCFLFLLAGCGGPKLFPVKGRVEYKGGVEATALANGMVIFQPADDDMPNISPRGNIESDGTFEMITPGEGTGVRPGKYKVIVTPPPFFAKSREASFNRPHLIDDSFSDFKTSGVEINVTNPVSDFTISVFK